MKILFLAKFIPFPLDNGGKIGSWGILEGFLKIGRTDFVSFYETKAERQNIERLKGICNRVEVIYKAISISKNRWLNYFYFLLSMMRGRPYFISKFASRRMQRLVAQLIKSGYDLVVADGLQMAQYVKDCQGTVILQEQNLEYEIMLRHYQQQKNILLKWLYYWDYQKLMKYEVKAITQVKNVFFFTERDQAAAKKLVPDLRSYFIPLAIDIDQFHPRLAPSFQKQVYTNGSLNLYPNLQGLIWFSNEVIPEILKADPQVQFYHVGAYREECKGLLHPAIKLVGYVDDITAHMNSSIIHAVPIKIGGGIRVKILNSMASGIPIVATPMAAQGILVENHQDVELADDGNDFAQALLSLLDSREKREQLIANGLAIIKRHYSKYIVHQRIANVVKEIK